MVSFVSPYRSWQGQEVHPDHRRIPQGRLASQELAQAPQKALNILNAAETFSRNCFGPLLDRCFFGIASRSEMFWLFCLERF